MPYDCYRISLSRLKRILLWIIYTTVTNLNVFIDMFKTLSYYLNQTLGVRDSFFLYLYHVQWIIFMDYSPTCLMSEITSILELVVLLVVKYLKWSSRLVFKSNISSGNENSMQIKTKTPSTDELSSLVTQATDIVTYNCTFIFKFKLTNNAFCLLVKLVGSITVTTHFRKGLIPDKLKRTGEI